MVRKNWSIAAARRIVRMNPEILKNVFYFRCFSSQFLSCKDFISNQNLKIAVEIIVKKIGHLCSIATRLAQELTPAWHRDGIYSKCMNNHSQTVLAYNLIAREIGKKTNTPHSLLIIKFFLFFLGYWIDFFLDNKSKYKNSKKQRIISIFLFSKKIHSNKNCNCLKIRVSKDYQEL